MSAYLIANIHVRDPLGYDEYRSRTQPIVESHGGRFLVRGGAIHGLEGDPQIGRFVVIEFPSADAANAFYNSADYQQILPARTQNADTTMFVVEGV